MKKREDKKRRCAHTRRRVYAYTPVHKSWNIYRIVGSQCIQRIEDLAARGYVYKIIALT